MGRNLKYIWRGLLDYETALNDQMQFLSSDQEAIWGLEHPRVITLGLSADPQGEIRENFHSNGKFNIIRVDRGGKATLHNKGQLIIYPQFVLNNYGFGIRTYVEALIKVTQQLLTELKVDIIKDHREVGLFTPNGKIGAIGIRVQNGRTYHGISLNICNNLQDFDAIRSCGLWNRPQDKLYNWDIALSTEDVYWLWINLWKKYLENN